MSIYYLRDDQGDGAIGGTATGEICPEALPSVSSSHYAARVKGVWVVDGGRNLNNSQRNTGSRLYQTQYSDSADQVARSDTCLLTDTTDREAAYYYDQTLRQRRVWPQGEPVGGRQREARPERSEGRWGARSRGT